LVVEVLEEDIQVIPELRAVIQHLLFPVHRLYLLVVDMEEEVVTEDLVDLVVVLVSLLVVVDLEPVLDGQEIIPHHHHQ
tara:strand:+ start:67 stop:303 length:237 start_codon:yes stop_codon:yes gene_type:complete